MENTMRHEGYMVVKIGKRSITICLFNENKEDLEAICKECDFHGVEIVPFFRTRDNRNYIEHDGHLIRLV